MLYTLRIPEGHPTLLHAKQNSRFRLLFATGIAPGSGQPDSSIATVAPLFPGEIGYREFVAHISEDDVEQYAMRTLNEADLDRLDDHLLVCPECQERLDETERY